MSSAQEIDAPKKIGRPSLKTPELCADICRRIAVGGSVAKVCRDEDMPDERTVWRWIYEDEEFRQAYTRAMHQRAMVQADEIRDLTERAMSSEIPPDVARVVIDAAKWTASRLLPKIYGERQEVSVNHQHTHTLHLDALRQLADEQRKTIDVQVIDLTQHPTLSPEVLDHPAPARRPRRLAPPIDVTLADPPPLPPGGGRSAAATPLPPQKKIRTPKNLKRADPA